jgi:flagellar biosynthetic protein FliR
MRPELTLSLATLYTFLLVLARIAGVFAFVPLPGIRSGPEMARVVLSLSLTVALFPSWPALPVAEPGFGQLAAWLATEAALGVAIGVCVALLLEAFVFGAQVMGLQAGYAYSSTIDPTSQADSGILLVLAQLVAGMLFFAVGLDREVIRTVARSLETHPPGTFVLGPHALPQIIGFGSAMLATGLRLAMPVVALLIVVDISLALLGRINAQLQLLTLAFPIKMLITLVLLGWIAVLLPALFSQAGGKMMFSIQTLVAH